MQDNEWSGRVTERLDCVVVGAGVVGLAIGRALALAGREVIVLEAESQIGMHSSSRNSEVIHAGIYYPEDSLKARLCVQGKEALYNYCARRGVAHQRIGKLIVATDDDDLAKLHAIEQQARKNGVEDLTFVTAEEMNKIEPQVVSIGALLSPSTGIVDSHELMSALQAEFEGQGGVVVRNSRVRNVKVVNDGLAFDVGDEPFKCKTLVNSAGLWATELAVTIGIDRPQGGPPQESIPDLYLAKGHYFAYQGKSPFSHLIYPVPSGGGLGIHATNDLAGTARFGPDVTWADEVDYGFDESCKPEFVTAIRRYFPALDADKLAPAYTGVRPKLHGPGEAPADFVIEGQAEHGVRGLVNLFGIESPGLTSSLAIGEYVTALLQ